MVCVPFAYPLFSFSPINQRGTGRSNETDSGKQRVPKLWIDDGLRVGGRAHLAGADRVVEGERQVVDVAEPVSVRVGRLMGAGRERRRMQRHIEALHGRGGQQFLSESDALQRAMGHGWKDGQFDSSASYLY